MSEIKSSYELALERTKDIQADHHSLLMKNCKEEGQRLFATFLKNPSVSIEQLLQKLSSRSSNEQGWIREGLQEVLLQNLSLPLHIDDLAQLNLIRTGLLAIKQQKEPVVSAFSRIEQLFRQYLKERESFSQRLQAHMAPMQKERELQLQQKLGRPVAVDITTLPEFAEQLHKGHQQLDANYQQVLSPVKQHLMSLPGVEK